MLVLLELLSTRKLKKTDRTQMLSDTKGHQGHLVKELDCPSLVMRKADRSFYAPAHICT